MVVPDGWRTVESNLGGYDDKTTWLIGPGPLAQVEIRQSPERVTDGWILKDPDAASEKFPAELTTQEWTARGLDDEDTDDGFMAQRIYTRRRREVPRQPTDTLTPLTGNPDPVPGRGWVADQPASLIYSWNYHHLFPGYMTGLHAAVVAALEAEVGKRHPLYYTTTGVRDRGTTGQYRGIEVTIDVPYETPRWREQRRVGRSGRKLKAIDRVPVTQKVTLNIIPGDTVTGATKTKAAARFDQIVAEWVEWVRSYQVVACDHCDGTGTVTNQSQRPS